MINYNSWVGKKVELKSRKLFASGNSVLTVRRVLPSKEYTFREHLRNCQIFLFEESNESVACFRCKLSK